jgi:hypothetical protein
MSLIFNSSIRHNSNFNNGPISDIDDFSYESDFFVVLKDTTEYKFYKISKFINVYAISIITLLGNNFLNCLFNLKFLNFKRNHWEYSFNPYILWSPIQTYYIENIFVIIIDLRYNGIVNTLY